MSRHTLRSLARSTRGRMAGKGGVSVRETRAEDMGELLGCIKALARYEKAEHEVQTTVEQLQRDGFEEPRRFHCLFAELDGKVAGFALYFFTYSTWEGLSLYLEDLYVKEEARGKGCGMALMAAVARVAAEQKCARFQWQAVDWNQSAIDFYTKKLGAVERLQDGAKWVNFIMGRDQVQAFLQTQG